MTILEKKGISTKIKNFIFQVLWFFIEGQGCIPKPTTYASEGCRHLVDKDQKSHLGSYSPKRGSGPEQNRGSKPLQTRFPEAWFSQDLTYSTVLQPQNLSCSKLNSRISDFILLNEFSSPQLISAGRKKQLA